MKTLQLIALTSVLSFFNLSAYSATNHQTASVPTTDTEHQQLQTVSSANENRTQAPRFIKKPNFSNLHLRVRFPPCHCNEKGKPLDDCQMQTVEIMTSMMVDKTGEAQNIRVVSGSDNHRLNRYVISSLKSARFHPFYINGQPVEGHLNIPIVVQYQPKMEAICHSRREQQLLSE